jgi:hypothetical protein
MSDDISRHKANSLRQEIAGMQEENPALTFADAWNRLRRQKPHLFTAAAPTTDGLAQARAQVGQQIKDQIDNLREYYPGMNTSGLFALARQQNPTLFVRAARIENGEEPARSVQAVNDYWWTGRSASGDYIMLRAADADELERQIAAGMWS